MNETAQVYALGRVAKCSGEMSGGIGKFFYRNNTISTLLFRCLPAGVLFVATGILAAMPFVVIAAGA